MLLEKIKLTNFKCFDEVEVTLSDMNVLVGANASGKSNFLQALKFLKDIQDYGLENAVSLQGGAEYLKNINDVRNTIHLFFSWNLDNKGLKLNPINEGGLSEPNILTYQKKKVEYGLKLKIEDDKVKVSQETAEIYYLIREYKIEAGRPIPVNDHLIDHRVLLENEGKNLKIDSVTDPDKLLLSNGRAFDLKNKVIDNALLFRMNFEKSDKETFLLQNFNFLSDTKLDFAIYDFDPQLSKKAISIAGKAELEENGENLAIVLKRILEDAEKKRTFLNLISELLPFVKDIGIERYYDKSLLFKIRETFQGNKERPSSLLSDGTIAIAMMVVVLFFEKRQLAIFEEPEHGIHPALIAKLMNLFYESSQKKQIFITTHNPEIVKYTQLQDLLLISRQANGSSTIIRPDNSQAVHAFLDSELGIDDLFTQNLLDV